MMTSLAIETSETRHVRYSIRIASKLIIKFYIHYVAYVPIVKHLLSTST